MITLSVTYFLNLSSSDSIIGRRWTDTSTSNPACHVNSCEGGCDGPCEPVSTYSIGLFRYLVAAWVASSSRPHSIIEDEHLIRIFTILNSTIHVHSRQTVARHISDVFIGGKTAVGRHPGSLLGRVHLCIDGWSSPDVIWFVGLTVHNHHKGVCASRLHPRFCRVSDYSLHTTLCSELCD